MWYDMLLQGHYTAKQEEERVQAARSRELRFTVGTLGPKGAAQSIPTLAGTARIDWWQLDVEDILAQFGTLKESFCRRVFRQKAAAAWFGGRAEKIQVTMVLPGEMGMDDWCETPGQLSHSSPDGITTGKYQLNPLTIDTFHRVQEAYSSQEPLVFTRLIVSQ